MDRRPKGAPLISWMLLGFTMGVRHALEADHLAAVASLSARAAGPGDLVRVASAWGVGHALTLLAVALLWVETGVTVPDRAQPFVESAAGVLLIWLGVNLLRGREGGWALLRPHEHHDGTRHVHLHWRAQQGATDATLVSHPHPPHPLRRALFVGSVHGLAGSALLGLLATGGAHAGRVITYAGLFGLGATAGMLLLSTAVSLPLRFPRVQAIASGQLFHVALAAVSIAIGTWISVRSISSISMCLGV